MLDQAQRNRNQQFIADILPQTIVNIGKVVNINQYRHHMLRFKAAGIL